MAHGIAPRRAAASTCARDVGDHRCGPRAISRLDACGAGRSRARAPPSSAQSRPGRRSPPATSCRGPRAAASASRVTIRRGKTKRGSPASAVFAAAISVSLPAPDGPTTRTRTPGHQLTRLPCRHTSRTTGCRSITPHPHQVGAHADGDLAAIVECRRRVPDCASPWRSPAGSVMSPPAPAAGTPHASARTARSPSTARRASPALRQVGRRDVARVRFAAHDVRRAHQHREPGLVRGLGRGQRRRELRDADAVAHAPRRRAPTVASSWLAKASAELAATAEDLARGWRRHTSPARHAAPAMNAANLLVACCILLVERGVVPRSTGTAAAPACGPSPKRAATSGKCANWSKCSTTSGLGSSQRRWTKCSARSRPSGDAVRDRVEQLRGMLVHVAACRRPSRSAPRRTPW